MEGKTLTNIKDKFRESMSRLAGGVGVVETKVDGRPWGLTISACSSISMDPPLIMISLAKDTVSTKAIKKEQEFNLSLLNIDQSEVSMAGAKSGEPKFFEKYMEKDEVGNYIKVKDALANINCSVYKIIEAGDHTIFIGLVNDVILGKKNKPLLHFDRQFGSFET